MEIEAVRKMSSSRSRSGRSGRSRKGTQTDPSNATSQTRPTTYSSKDPAFQQAIVDARYYPHGYEYSDDEDAPIPNDLDEDNERLQQPRPSLSPSRFTVEDFRHFQRSNMRATSEGTVMRNVFPIILGRNTIPSGDNYPFNNLEPLANNISDAVPDYFNGSHPKQAHPKVRKDLGKYIIPSNDDSRPLLPNFFIELKGPKGDAAQMKLQITQDLRYGARGMYKTRSYGQDQPVYDGNTYTYGATYHNGTSTLQLYGMHPTEPADLDGDPEYHTTKLIGFDLTANPNTFRQGAGAFRNLQDLAKEKRDRFIAYANEVAARQLQQEQEEIDDNEEEEGVDDENEEEVGEDEEDDEDEDDEDDEEEQEDDEDEEENPAMFFFPSLSQASTQNQRSLTSDMALPDSDTSTDELQRDYNPLAKRPSKSSYYLQRRKRRT